MKTEEGLSKQGFQPPTISANDSNREVILRYEESGGIGIELTDKQKELRARWIWCDEMMRENVGKLKREAIANLLRNKFNITRSTAYQDIVNTEYVYSTSTPFNKKYRMGIRMEFLESEIRSASQSGDFLGVAKLEAILQKYIAEYPDVTPKSTPQGFLINANLTMINNLVIEKNEAETYIDQKTKEYTEFEELEIDDEEVNPDEH